MHNKKMKEAPKEMKKIASAGKKKHVNMEMREAKAAPKKEHEKK